jgi:arabinoxylan arabinofuranohydrolase
MAAPVVRAGIVDGIGLQAHGLADWYVPYIEHKLTQVAALGLPLYMSECDIQKTNDQEKLRVMQA